MAFGIVLIGMMVGLGSAVWALTLGSSVLVTLLVYSFSGALGMVAASVLAALAPVSVPGRTKAHARADGIAENTPF